MMKWGNGADMLYWQEEQEQGHGGRKPWDMWMCGN